MKKMLTTAIILGLSLGFTGCVKTSGNINVSKANTKTLKQDIIKNVTTKSELEEKYGEPAIKTQEDGVDKWQFIFAKSQTDNKNMIPLVGLFTGAKSKMDQKIITVYFNENGTVKDYKLENRHTEKGIGDVFHFGKK